MGFFEIITNASIITTIGGVLSLLIKLRYQKNKEEREAKEAKEAAEKEAAEAVRKAEREADKAEHEAEKRQNRKMQVLRVASDREYKKYDITSKNLVRATAHHIVEMEVNGKNDYKAFSAAHEKNEEACKSYEKESDKLIDAMWRLAEGNDVSDDEIREVINGASTQ